MLGYSLPHPPLEILARPSPPHVYVVDVSDFRETMRYEVFDRMRDGVGPMPLHDAMKAEDIVEGVTRLAAAVAEMRGADEERRASKSRRVE